jgi:DNA-binding Lrp family transcriptional regulator
MKQNVHVIISADIAKRLARDPQRSNRSIADELGVSEFAVRRMRTVLELGGLLAATGSRIGMDGVEQRFSPA